MDFLSLGVKEISSLLRTSDISVPHLIASSLRRQETVSSLNVFITLPQQKDVKSAAALSQERINSKKAKGLLEGIPVVVKDNFCTQGLRTTCGSRMLENYVPPYDATIVDRLKKAGAIIMGKTNMDEFAMGCGTTDSAFGATKNLYGSRVPYEIKDGASVLPKSVLPEDDWYVSGGSSGGSAVAVSTGIAAIGIGSDTGGSVRNPASYCGVVGFKPSYGTISRYGLISLVNSMDVPGIFARSVDDVTLAYSVLAGKDDKDSTSLPVEVPAHLPDKPSLKGVVVGVPKECHCEGLDSEVLEVWTKTAKLMQKGGAVLRSVSLPHILDSILCYSVLNACEVASNFTRYTGLEYGLKVYSSHSMEATYALSRAAGLGEVVRGRILAGNYFLLRENQSKYFRQALKVRRLIYNEFANVFADGIDCLLMPSTLTAAQRFSQFSVMDNRTQVSLQDIITQSANVAGCCAIVVPVNLSKESLPLSLQIYAPHGCDEQLLMCAKWLESNVQFPKIIIND